MAQVKGSTRCDTALSIIKSRALLLLLHAHLDAVVDVSVVLYLLLYRNACARKQSQISISHNQRGKHVGIAFCRSMQRQLFGRCVCLPQSMERLSAGVKRTGHRATTKPQNYEESCNVNHKCSECPTTQADFGASCAANFGQDDG